ncbi:MAG: hypothetical protein ACP5XB_21535 [Isosphaeraceae bacterium]
MNGTLAGGDQQEVICLLVLVQFVLGASLYFNFLSHGVMPKAATHLGGEHRCIAQSLAAGRGFADPFGIPTGQTAWMAPVFPALLAVLFKFLDGIEAVASVVLLLQDLVLIYMGLLVLRFASGPGHAQRDRTLALVLYLAALACHYRYMFIYTHDHVIVLFWICLFMDLSDRLYARLPSVVAAVGWGVAGGLATLTSPVLGPVWAGLTVTLAASAGRVRRFAVSGLIAAAVVTPWTVRNALVFHRLIPVKSNLPFELYQSQCLEPDGVLREATALTHPYVSDGEEHARYKQLGEMKYLDEKGRAFLESVRGNPLSFCKRVFNRLLAASVLHIPYESRNGSVSQMLGRIIFPLPVVGMVLMLASPGWAKDRRKVIALVIFVMHLTPYILVSYYVRYAIPLLPIKVLFCFWGLESATRAVWPPGRLPHLREP